MSAAIHGYVARAVGQTLEPFEYEPRPLGECEVRVAVSHCGVCHTDIHAIDDDYGLIDYPFMPGHEIVGHVAAAGRGVTSLKEGDRVGIGWQGRSCGHCEWCLRGEEQFCMDIVDSGTWIPYGGFSSAVTVDHRFAHPLPDAMPSEVAAVLMCAGISTYAPLRALSSQPGQAVGIVGVGGLGHLAIQFAHALGHEVTVISSSPDKEQPARDFGADDFLLSDPTSLKKADFRFDVVLCTAPADVNWDRLLWTLKKKGQLILLGFPRVDLDPLNLVARQLTIRGSFMSNRAGFRDMLAFVHDHPIRTFIESMPMSRVNEAIQRVRENKARYRIVLTN